MTSTVLAAAMAANSVAVVAATSGTNPDDNRGAFVCLGAFALLVLVGIVIGAIKNRGGGGRHR